MTGSVCMCCVFVCKQVQAQLEEAGFSHCHRIETGEGSSWRPAVEQACLSNPETSCSSVSRHTQPIHPHVTIVAGKLSSSSLYRLGDRKPQKLMGHLRKQENVFLLSSIKLASYVEAGSKNCELTERWRFFLLKNTM